MRFEHNVQVHDDSFVLLGVAGAAHLLHRNHLAAELVPHLHHVSAGAVAQLAQVLQIRHLRLILLSVDV